MKVSFSLVLVAALAGTGMASPVKRENSGVFDFLGVGGPRGGNVFSDIFDQAACLVSGVIGGGNPRCGGRGTLGGALSLGGNGGNLGGTPGGNSHGGNGGKPGGNGGKPGGNGGKPDIDFNSDANSSSYSFNYSTDGNGKIKITITPDAKNKKPCTTEVDASSGELQQLIKDAAKKCL